MAVLLISVGRDATLLAIRSLILANAGYGVVAVASEKEFRKKFQEGDFDAVVLCHTLPEEQRTRICEMVHAHSPSTPIVASHHGSNGSNGANGSSSDRALVFGDTRDLLRILPQVLRPSSEERRAM